MKKTKFRVLVYIPILSIIYLFISLICLYFVLTYSNKQDILFIGIISLIMFIVVPLALVVLSFLQMWPCVEFSTEGIEKTFLGKKIRFITWNEIYEIKRINTGIAEWLFFSKTSLEDKSIDKCRRRKDNIFIVSTKEIEEVINHFAPSRLLQK